MREEKEEGGREREREGEQELTGTQLLGELLCKGQTETEVSLPKDSVFVLNDMAFLHQKSKIFLNPLFSFLPKSMFWTICADFITLFLLQKRL